MKKDKLKKILLGFLKLLYYIVIGFVCIIAGILVYYIISVQVHSKDENYVPGFSIYTIVSPSMTPNINVYDVVVNIRVKQPEDIEVGDIITFKSQAATSEGMTITHRVISVDQLPDGTYEYMTQGDNNPEPDNSYVTFENIIGKEIVTIPKLGKVQFLIANKKSWLFLLLIPVTIYLIKEIYKLIDLLGLKKKVKKVTEPKEDKPEIDKEKQEQLKQQLKEELIREGVIAPTIKQEETKKIDETKIELPKIKEYEVLNTSDLPLKENEYLEGKKLKVVSVEETKNKKRNKLSIERTTTDDGKIHLGNDNIPYRNPHMKVERPEGEDIKELRKNELNNKSNQQKKNLNLNPNKVKKINRNKKNDKKQLNLNPGKMKKVNRYPNKNNKPKKKKQHLIVIEKIK